MDVGLRRPAEVMLAEMRKIYRGEADGYSGFAETSAGAPNFYYGVEDEGILT